MLELFRDNKVKWQVLTFLDQHFFLPILGKNADLYSREDQAILQNIQRYFKGVREALRRSNAVRMFAIIDVSLPLWLSVDQHLKRLRLPTTSDTLEKMYMCGRFSSAIKNSSFSFVYP